jgi:hypothetical protein
MLLQAEGIRHGAVHVSQVNATGDGAARTWSIATAKLPEAPQIVDYCHAREHVRDLARLLEFTLLDLKDE